MNSKSIELQVGIVIFLAIIILGYGVLWLKEYRFNIQRYSYTVIFPEVGSLDIGDPVAVLGVDKGEVEKIKLMKGNVYVTFNLTDDVVLRKDAEFTVMNIGLMGERFIQIKPGISDTMLDLSVPVKGYYDTGIPEVMGMLGHGIDELRELIRVLSGTIGTEQASIDMKAIIENLLNITRQTREVLDSTGGKFKTAVDDLSYSASTLRSMVDSNQIKLQRTVDNLDSLSAGTIMLVNKLTELSDQLKMTADKLESDSTTIGKMLRDRQLYDRIDRTVVDLDSLILDIKKHPKKYIHLEIF